jgi:hypothetical protein
MEGNLMDLKWGMFTLISAVFLVLLALLFHKIEELLAFKKAALLVLLEPHGCPFCDSGKLRNPDKDHADNCEIIVALPY